MVLGFVRANEPAGCAQIARSCELSIQAVANIIESLKDDGLLSVDTPRRDSTVKAPRGKQAVRYRCNPDGAYSIGIELRPDAIICAVLNLSGENIYNDSAELSDASPASAVPLVAEMVARAIAKKKLNRTKLLGVGLVMPGPFGNAGQALSTRNQNETAMLPGWDDVDIQSTFQSALDCFVVVENDAIAAAISERVAGIATGLDSFCFLYFGTGLGLGVIANGQAQRGAFGNAGEIGHITTYIDGTQGNLETYASRMAAHAHLLRANVSLPENVPLSQTLSTLFEQKNPALLDWIDSAAKHLSQATGLLENLFDPETIIFGGALPDTILDALIAKLSLPQGSVANRQDRDVARVLRGSSGRLTAAIGGAAMVIHQAITPSLTLYP